jgi:hypothetical protein
VDNKKTVSFGAIQNVGLVRSLIAYAAMLALLFSLTACGGNNENGGQPASYDNSASQEQASGSLNSATSGDSASNTANASNTSNTASEPKVIDLAGDWKQSNSNSSTSYQTAKISENTIEVYWNDEETGIVSLYWAGTFIAPKPGVNEYSWDSIRDEEKTASAILASQSESKSFSYKDETISYEVSAMGMTTTVVLVRNDASGT